MSKKTALIISLLLIITGCAGRLLPHLWNATPITAILLLASAYLGIRYAGVILIATMLISDIFLGFYQWQIMLTVYVSLMLVAVIGLVLQKTKAVEAVFMVTIGSSVLFFIITNCAVWYFGTMYDHSLSGLMQSYVMSLPFFKNSLMGDIVYTGLLFGVMQVAPRVSPASTKRDLTYYI